MKAGRTLQSLSEQIVLEAKSKKDYIVSTSALSMNVVANEGVPDVALHFNVQGQERVYKPTKLCLDQMAARLEIPRAYADRMRTEAPELLCRNVNHWFSSKPEKRMLRTFDNGTKVARAFLGDGYRVMDNYDLFEAVYPKLQQAGCEVHSAEITETRFYIQASTPKIKSIIEQELTVGGHNRINRTVQAGLVISNSEVGAGMISVEPILYDLVCTNGLIVSRSLKRRHAGRRSENEALIVDEAYEMFTDETKKLDDRAFWAKVGDVVTSSLDEIKFNDSVNRLRDAQKQTVIKDNTELPKVVELVSNRFNFNEGEKGSLLLHLAQGRDFSKFGLIQAVTRTAEDVPGYDRAIELERLGGQILELPPTDFRVN